MADFYDILINQIKVDDFYAILGCDELATTDQINAEFRQKAKNLHPDKNPDEENAQLFESLQYARNILCDEKERKKYDYWRRSGIAVPYKQWRELSGAVHTSLHWAAKPRKELMLKYRKEATPVEANGSNYSCDRNGGVKRFKSTNPSDNCSTAILQSMVYMRWRSRRGRNISKFRNYEI